MKPEPDPGEGTPFERFDRLMRTVIAVPKSVVVKAEEKERLRNQRKREATKDKTVKTSNR
ncbi:MAG TPA: hypothetical protein VGO47_14310 [Chlamydiales bacterium]|nr:hypothetical protein [Chlamydiales bacterium]